MILRRNCPLLLLVWLGLISFVFASAPTSFCKCTCFSNSTIIPLEPSDSESSTSSSTLFVREDDHGGGSKNDGKQYKALNCNDCNRRFCLDYHLPMCKGAKEEDIFATCFQRDSKKDKAVVFIFIIATAGLLIWAAIKPWVEKYINAARRQNSYLAISSQEVQ